MSRPKYLHSRFLGAGHCACECRRSEFYLWPRCVIESGSPLDSFVPLLSLAVLAATQEDACQTPRQGSSLCSAHTGTGKQREREERYNRHALTEVVSHKMDKLMSFSSAVLRALQLLWLVPYSALRASQTSLRLVRSPPHGSIHKLNSLLGLICPQFTPNVTSDLFMGAWAFSKYLAFPLYWERLMAFDVGGMWVSLPCNIESE
ncbi:hypothetical protein PO909_018505 [Leuciscus waleckii]